MEASQDKTCVGGWMQVGNEAGWQWSLGLDEEQ